MYLSWTEEDARLWGSVCVQIPWWQWSTLTFLPPQHLFLNGRCSSPLCVCTPLFIFGLLSNHTTNLWRDGNNIPSLTGTRQLLCDFFLSTSTFGVFRCFCTFCFFVGPFASFLDYLSVPVFLPINKYRSLQPVRFTIVSEVFFLVTGFIVSISS